MGRISAATYIKVILLTGIAAVHATAFATPPPQSKSLWPLSGKKQEVDDALQRWLDTMQPIGISWDKANLEPNLQAETAAMQALIRLRKAKLNHGEKSETTREQIKTALASVGNLAAPDPILPYLLEEIAKLDTENDGRAALEHLRTLNGGSCPEKELIIRDIDAEKKGGLTSENAKSLLERILQFRSSDYIESALDSYLQALPSERRDDVRVKLVQEIERFPKLRDDNLWILGKESAVVTDVLDEDDGSEASKHDKAVEPWKSFNAARSQSRGKLCNTAHSSFERGINLDKRKVAMAEVEKVAKKVEACFRGKGKAARVRYWQNIQDPLKKRYGFYGEEIALRARGLILWGDDQFEESKLIFQNILQQATKDNLTAIQARTIYTFARIEENEGKLASAADFYEQLLTRFPDNENVETARMSLIVIYASTGKHAEGIRHIDAIINEQDQLNIDERSQTSLPFALFWGGRLHMSLGNRDLALDLFRRVASEYYSTFYAAVAHNILERTEKKSYELQPSWTGNFHAQNYVGAFDQKQQNIIKRVIQLNRLGLKDSAQCELSELEDGDKDSRKQLIRTVLLFAVGDWLEAVKRYNDLPRSFRNSLPRGMERLLFPRAFEDKVDFYTKRLDLDPDLILAIIRQESVFNPRARSPVGARGLMQLMPATAVVEVKKLSQGYMTMAQRKQLLTHAGDASQLYDAETNVAIGVHHASRLLQKYRNAIFLLTSYNANPRATERWIQNIPSDDMLTFIERIPYGETKAYVKLVLRNYFYYKRWYGDVHEPLPHLDLLTSVLVRAQDASPL